MPYYDTAEYCRRSRIRGGVNQFKRRPWTQAEIFLILTAQVDDLALARMLKRSTLAIQNKRSREGGFRGDWDGKGKAIKRTYGEVI